MRTHVWLALTAAASITLSGQEPQSQPAPETQIPVQGPTFRTGVDLVTVDVGVSDERGRPVTDLLPPDFVVKIDGQVRRVVSAEHVRIDIEAARREAARDTETFFTSNLSPPNGRMIVIAVDQSNIRPGAARPLLATAARFLDKLSPSDRVAFVAYPPPGETVDFTTDFAKIRNSMQRVTGMQMRYKGRFNIGLFEAKAIVERHDELTRREVVLRECGSMAGGELERCERDVELEVSDMVNQMRVDTAMSLRGLRDLLTNLSLLEGQKALILLSEGLVLEGLGSELDEIVQLANMGRVSINVLLMDVPRFDVTQAQLPPSAGEDRELQIRGLDNLAGLARGALYHVVGSGEAIFDRLASELSAYYLLGVEQAPGDRDGKRHRIDVEVRRRNVLVRSRRAFVLSSAEAAKRTPEERLVTALKTPFAVAELPMRVTSYAYQDPSAGKVRLVIAAEIGQAGAPPAEFTMGYVLIDDQGRVASSGQQKRRLEPLDGRPNVPLGYFFGLVVDPGVYSLRLAAVDAEGRRGSVLREVNAWKIEGEEFAVGDLLVGSVPGPAESLMPQVEPRVHDGRMAAHVELYAGSAGAFEQATVHFEIADDEDAEALAVVPGRMGEGSAPTTRIAQAMLITRMLPPGRYVARARIARDGKPAGVLLRPFILERTAATDDDAAGVAVPMSMIESLPRFNRELVLAPDVIASVLELVQRTSPGLTDALAAAREGRYGAAALEALSGGDQIAAMFFRGLEHFVNNRLDQAAAQLGNAAGPRREYFPAAFYLGACFAAAGRDRDAAGVWQLGMTGGERPPIAYTLFADARLRDNLPDSVIDVLKPAYDRMPDNAEIAKRLATAYVMTGHYAEAVPVLDAYLSSHASDPEALFAAIMAHYQVTTQAKVPLSDAERAKVTRYARAYKGPQQALIAKYLAAMNR